jgi:hypothetical protein
VFDFHAATASRAVLEIKNIPSAFGGILSPSMPFSTNYAGTGAKQRTQQIMAIINHILQVLADALHACAVLFIGRCDPLPCQFEGALSLISHMRWQILRHFTPPRVIRVRLKALRNPQGEFHRLFSISNYVKFHGLILPSIAILRPFRLEAVLGPNQVCSVYIVRFHFYTFHQFGGHYSALLWVVSAEHSARSQFIILPPGVVMPIFGDYFVPGHMHAHGLANPGMESLLSLTASTCGIRNPA